MSDRQPPPRRRQGPGFTIDDLYGLLAISAGAILFGYFLLVVPFLFMREILTQSESFWIYFGHEHPYHIAWAAWSLFVTGALVFVFVVLYDTKWPVSGQISMFAGAVVGNIWLGIGIWLTAVKLLHIPVAVSDPGRFGSMVWWNLLHGVPLLNIDSALDWEQPIEEYPVSIGWLLLVQQVVLLLTLARSIQILVSVTLSSTTFDSLDGAVRRQRRREDRRQAKKAKAYRRRGIEPP